MESGGLVGTERKNQNKLSARNEQARGEMEKLQEEMEDTGQKIADHKTLWNWSWIPRSRKQARGRRGSNALQSTHGRPSRWEQYWQGRISQSSKVNSTECMASQHQPAPATPAHQGMEQSAGKGEGGHWDEEQRKSMRRVFGPLAPGRGSQPRVSGCFCFFDPSLFPYHGRGEGDGGAAKRRRRDQRQAVSSERRQFNRKDRISVAA